MIYATTSQSATANDRQSSRPLSSSTLCCLRICTKSSAAQALCAVVAQQVAHPFPALPSVAYSPVLNTLLLKLCVICVLSQAAVCSDLPQALPSSAYTSVLHIVLLQSCVSCHRQQFAGSSKATGPSFLCAALLVPWQ